MMTFEMNRDVVDSPSGASNPLTAVSPLSGSTNVTRLRRLETTKLVSDWKQQFNIDITPELRGIQAVEILRCNESGLTFFAPRELAGSEHLYAQLRRIPWYYDTGKWEHAMARALFAPNQAVLDVGCGDGAFVAMACAAGLDASGIDTCSAAIDAGKAKGIRLTMGDVTDLAAERPESFDGVCSFQVLEHVPDPLKFIDACVRATRRGGKIVFAVPNAKGYLKHCYDLLDLPPHHMSRWCARSFRYLERSFPITLSHVAYQPLSASQRATVVQAMKARLRPTRLGWFIGRQRVLHAYSRFLTAILPWTLRGHSMCAVFIKR